MKFYLATGKSRDKLLALHEESTQVRRNRNKFCGEFKANGCVLHQSRLVGLKFCHDAPSPWVPSKKLSQDVPDSFVPSTSKEGRELRKRMRGVEYTDPIDHFAISAAVGAEAWLPGKFTIAGFTILCGKVIVGLDEYATPRKDCERISDLEYETLLAKEEAARKRKRRKAVKR